MNREDENLDKENELEETSVEATEQEEQSTPVEEETTPEQEIEKWKSTALRTAAELENYRKRTARDLGEARKYGNSGLLRDLLPVIDNFSMGLQAASQDESSMIYQGMKMVNQQLIDFLENNGVKTVDPTGEKFDPNLHEAISQQETTEHEEGTIITVVRSGYTLNDRLLRPANVIVAAAPASENEPAEEESENTEA